MNCVDFDVRIGNYIQNFYTTNQPKISLKLFPLISSCFLFFRSFFNINRQNKQLSIAIACFSLHVFSIRCNCFNSVAHVFDRRIHSFCLCVFGARALFSLLDEIEEMKKKYI